MLLTGCGLMTNYIQAQQTDRSSKIFTKETASVNNPIDVKTIENRIVVSNAPVSAKMEIYNIIGTKVYEIEMKQSSGEYIFPLSKGYYIVRIAGTVRKIVIR
jgi:hypothetical protein